MKTLNRRVESETDRDMAARLVENRPIPFTLSITSGKQRSVAQNRLLHMWMSEIAEQRGDITAEEARAYCKLTIGVPILRNQNEAFRLRYDEALKPLSYPQKLAIMSEPLNLPVTSLMTTKQLTEYLEGIIQHFGEQGVVLSMPDDLRTQIYSNPADDAAPSSSAVSADDAPTSAEDGEGSPSALPSSPITEEEWLVVAARMFWSATPRVPTETSMDTLRTQAASVGYQMPPGTSEAARERANSIYFKCKEALEDPNKRGDILRYIANRAGCDVSELEG